MKHVKKVWLFFVIMSLSTHLLYTEDSLPNTNKKAIIIGATSGMGREVAKLLAKDGYVVGLVGRRLPLLQSLQQEIETDAYIKQIDVTQDDAVDLLNELIDQIGGIDLMLISISSFLDTGFENTWEANKKIIDVDLRGFWAMAHAAVERFEMQGYGHLVGISSIDGIRGSAACPVFSGAKAFVSKYLEGVRNRMLQDNMPIYVTDIIPGWVNVEHTVFSDIPGTYWVSTKEDAAQQIFDAIKYKKKVAYITKRWQVIAMLLALAPDNIFNSLDKLRVGIGRAAEQMSIETGA